MSSRHPTSARRATPSARGTWIRKIGAKLAPDPAKVWPYTLAVSLLPLIVLWHRDNALYSPPWYSDPWFYLGFFRNLVEFKGTLFLNYYYGSRLSWILPGFLIHSLFSAVTANCVLHLTVQIVATLSLFSILRLTAGVRRAYLATMVFSVQPWLWVATGWDYPDGAGIAYCLLAMALLTRNALQPVGKWSLLLAGMARITAVQHMTFCINSLCHTIGRRPYTTKCSARDSWIMALCTFGEGYHNYHHEFQHDYRNGVKWWQWDPTKWTIWTLKNLRLVRGLRRVPDHKILLAQLAETRRQLSARLAACQQRPLPERLRELLQASDAKLDELDARWVALKVEYAAKADQKIRDARASLAELRRELRQAIELLEMAGAPA